VSAQRAEHARERSAAPAAGERLLDRRRSAFRIVAAESGRELRGFGQIDRLNDDATEASYRNITPQHPVFPETPVLKFIGQFGLYAGARSNRAIRGGVLKLWKEGAEAYTQFLVNNPDGNDRLLARLIALYRDDSSQLLADIDNAMKTSDAEAVARAAHTLKSSSANLGATNVAAIARQIEHAARGGDLKDLPASVTKLRAQRTVALSELEALENSAKVA